MEYSTISLTFLKKFLLFHSLFCLNSRKCFQKGKSFLHLSSLQSWQTCIGQLLPNACQLSTTNQTIPTTPIIITINIIGTVITTISISIVLCIISTGIFTAIQQIKLPPLTTNTKTMFTPNPMENSGICFNWWTSPIADWWLVAIGRPFRPCGCTIMDACKRMFEAVFLLFSQLWPRW